MSYMLFLSNTKYVFANKLFYRLGFFISREIILYGFYVNYLHECKRVASIVVHLWYIWVLHPIQSSVVSIEIGLTTQTMVN